MSLTHLGFRRVRGTALCCSALAWVLGCSAAQRPDSIPVDCSIEDDYEFIQLQTFEGGANSWFGFGDCTPGGSLNNCNGMMIPVGNGPVVEPIEDGPLCGDSLDALVLRSTGHQDWGSGFGEFQTVGSPANGEDFEGISFWARSPGNTTKQLTFTVQDANTRAEGGRCSQCSDHGDCTDVATPQCLMLTNDGDIDLGLCGCTANVQVDPNNCGACGSICPLGQWCVQGFCSTGVTNQNPNGCESDDDCNAGTPFCDDSGDTGICVECQDDEDCSPDNCGSGVCGSGGRCLFEDGTDDDNTCGDTEVCDGGGEFVCTDNVSSGFIGDASGNPTIVVPGEFCGNNFRTIVNLSNDWKLHFFPFGQFAQDPLPSRSPDGIDRAAIYGFGFTVPKESEVDFWLDDLSFYRRVDSQ